jgi:HTH-type transcriptional regulator / antitoxin HipB
MHDRSFRGFTEAVGEVLRKRRVGMGLHQVDLAELAGCSTRFVHTIEAGKGTLRFDKLAAVLRVLGLRFRLELGQDPVVDPRLQESP